MRRRFMLLALGLTLSAVVASCQKTAEGETRKWNRNVQKAEETIALYPAFASALRSDLQKAKAIMAEAGTLSDENSRVQKLEEGNRLVARGVFLQLREVDREIKDLRSSMVRAAEVNTKYRLAARQATDNAKRALRKVEERLQQGAQDVTSAKAVLTQALDDLRSARSDLETVTKKSMELESTRRSSKSSNQGTHERQTAPSKPTAPQFWTCAYCRGKNSNRSTRCSSCGAPAK